MVDVEVCCIVEYSRRKKEGRSNAKMCSFKISILGRMTETVVVGSYERNERSIVETVLRCIVFSWKRTKRDRMRNYALSILGRMLETWDEVRSYEQDER